MPRAGSVGTAVRNWQTRLGFPWSQPCDFTGRSAVFCPAARAMANRERALFVNDVLRLLCDVAPLHAMSAACCLWRKSVTSTLEAAHMLPAQRAAGSGARAAPRARARAGGSGRLRGSRPARGRRDPRAASAGRCRLAISYARQRAAAVLRAGSIGISRAARVHGAGDAAGLRARGGGRFVPPRAERRRPPPLCARRRHHGALVRLALSAPIHLCLAAPVRSPRVRRRSAENASRPRRQPRRGRVRRPVRRLGFARLEPKARAQARQST